MKELGRSLLHPSAASLCSSLETSCQHLVGGEYDSSLQWSEIALAFTWEQLNTGNWKDVSLAWRQAYSLATFLKAIALTMKGQLKEALVEVDKGILMGAPVFDNVLPALATELTGEIQTVSQTRLTTQHPEGAGSDVYQQMPSEAVSNPKQRHMIIFKNYKPFQDIDSLQSYGNSEQSGSTSGERPNPKRPRTNSSDTSDQPAAIIPQINPALRVPMVHSPSLETFHKQYMMTSIPVIITGAMDHWPAYSDRKWR